MFDPFVLIKRYAIFPIKTFGMDENSFSMIYMYIELWSPIRWIPFSVSHCKWVHKNVELRQNHHCSLHHQCHLAIWITP